MRLVDGLCDLARAIADIGTVAIFVLTVVEIVCRYVFSAPLYWVLDTTTYLMCGVVFLGLPVVTRAGAHISVTLIADTLSARKKRIVDILTVALTGAACFATAIITASVLRQQFASGIVTMANFGIPAWILMLALVIGFSLTAIVHLRSLMRLIRG